MRGVRCILSGSTRRSPGGGVRSLRSTVEAPAAVRVVEVGPRDGLQNEPRPVATAQKVRLVQLLHRAGLRHIEAGSFVSPKWVPAMADSLQVMEALHQWRQEEEKNPLEQGDAGAMTATTASADGLVLSCLVPNVAGLELALQARADEIAVFASASEGFSRRNLNCGREEALRRYRAVLERVPADSGVRVRGYVSCAIACPYDGPVSPGAVAEATLELLDMGCHQVSLGDTVGVGTPSSILSMLRTVQDAVGSTPGDDDRLAVHFHDTYGQGLANLLVALERQVRTVDAAVAGLGGCPYARGATGNVASEDVVYMLHGLGVATGVDLDALVDAGEYICAALGRESNSRAGRAIAAMRRA